MILSDHYVNKLKEYLQQIFYGLINNTGYIVLDGSNPLFKYSEFASIAQRLVCWTSTPKMRVRFPLLAQSLSQSNVTNSAKRKRLIEEGIKEAKCEICNLSEWMGKPIPLELHHIDFNHYNNNLDNL